MQVRSWIDPHQPMQYIYIKPFNSLSHHSFSINALLFIDICRKSHIAAFIFCFKISNNLPFLISSLRHVSQDSTQEANLKPTETGGIFVFTSHHCSCPRRISCLRIWAKQAKAHMWRDCMCTHGNTRGLELRRRKVTKIEAQQRRRTDMVDSPHPSALQMKVRRKSVRKHKKWGTKSDWTGSVNVQLCSASSSVD